MKKLAKLKWHASDPYQNGFIIPKYLPNGKAFHGSHYWYNDWVRLALNKLDGVPDQQLMSKMDKFKDYLKLRIEDAYSKGESLNVYFDRLDDFELGDLDF